MIIIISTPKNMPIIFPMPPRKEVPPTTTAAIALSSQPVPTLDEKADRRIVWSTAANAVKTPTIMKVVVFTILVLIAIARAARALSPVEKIQLPNRWGQSRWLVRWPIFG